MALLTNQEEARLSTHIEMHPEGNLLNLIKYEKL